MTITLNGTTGITTPDVTSSGSLNIDASAPDNSLVVSSAGNVGIGTSSPSTYGGQLVVANATNAVARLVNTKNGSWTVGDSFGELNFYSSDTSGAGVGDRGFVKSITEDTFGAAAALTFGTASSGGIPSERMRIDSSGNLLVGTTSSTNAGLIKVHASEWTLGSRVTGTTDLGHLAFYNSNGLIGSIRTNGSSTSYYTSSDYRLKEDWQPMAGASERVKALKPVNFAWKVDGSRVDGFLAHELAEVVPEAVTGEKDATEMVDVYDEDGNVTGQKERPVYQGIDQSKLVPLLTAALQEALAKIDALTARVEALEGATT
jgi:hypothetical protein